MGPKEPQGSAQGEVRRIGVSHILSELSSRSYESSSAGTGCSGALGFFKAPQMILLHNRIQVEHVWSVLHLIESCVRLAVPLPLF